MMNGQSRNLQLPERLRKAGDIHGSANSRALSGTLGGHSGRVDTGFPVAVLKNDIVLYIIEE
jgi:hypothetical protein